MIFKICEPASGGTYNYTWTWPAPFNQPMTVGSGINSCSIQEFMSTNATTIVPQSPGVTGVTP
jgi:hypothetical protein